MIATTIEEPRPFQIWKSKYTEIYYKVFGGSTRDVEMYDLDNIFDSKVISKEELRKHFVLQNNDN
jgi:hypothetical protein